MIVFNCTKAAADFFTRTVKGKKSSSIQPSEYKTIAEAIKNESETVINPVENWHWLVHVITVKRKKVIIVMDYHTRFSVSLTGIKKADENEFIAMFTHHLILHAQELMQLLVMHKTESELQKADVEITNSLALFLKENSSSIFHQRGDRSAQATINDVACFFNSDANNIGYVMEDFQLIKFDSFVNQQLRKNKGQKDYFCPHHEFLRFWLSNYTDDTSNIINEKITQLEQLDRELLQEEFDSLDEELDITDSDEPDEEDVLYEMELVGKKLKSLSQNNVINESDESNVVCFETFRKNSKK